MRKIAGMLLSVKTDRQSYSANIWRVDYRVKVNGQIEQRTAYVVGGIGCGGPEDEWLAATEVARSYSGKRIRILAASFVATGRLIGSMEENIDRKFEAHAGVANGDSAQSNHEHEPGYPKKS